MKFNPENQFESPKEWSDLLTAVFSEEYESQKAITIAKGGQILEDSDAFCKKKSAEVNESIKESQEKILNGIMAFLNTEDGFTNFLPMLKNFSRLENMEDESLSNKSVIEILEISDDDFIKLYNAACEEINKASYQTASEMFTFLNWLNPLMYYSLINVGLAESMLGHHIKAQEIFDFCLNMFPEEPILHIYAANNFHMMKELDKAREHLKQGFDLANAASDHTSLEFANKLKAKLA